MSYDLEKVLTRASEDLERGTKGKTASESLEAYRRFRRLEEHRLRLRISSGAGGREVVRQRSDLDDLLAQTGGLTAAAGPIFMPSDVLFGYDESFLRPEAITSLEKLGELIRRNPEARFRIEGHTDSFGDGNYNAQLSLARADSVKRWLAETMSIDPARIDTRGLGSTRPLAPVGGTVEEQQLNRRVEIVILRADGGR